jgi:uncharacterized cupredoxin-like copper-binding protein
MHIKKKMISVLGSAIITASILTGCGSDHKTINVSAYEMGYTPDTITLKQGEEYELIMKNDGNLFHDLTSDNFNIEITEIGEMAEHPESASIIDKLFGINKAYADGGHGHGDTFNLNKLHMNANAGQTIIIKFIPKEKGELVFYCSVEGHKAAGMVGTFIVE